MNPTTIAQIVSSRVTHLSPCRRYRFVLWREFDMFQPGYCVFIGLNPSTADETRDDLTIAKCKGYAQRWGMGAVCMVNLFAFRATNPEVMKSEKDPVGPGNDDFILAAAAGAGRVIAAWGDHGSHLDRCLQVGNLLSNLECLGRTRSGQPLHPSRTAYNLPLEPWTTRS